MLPAIFLMGPTAAGKTAVSIELAQHLPVEIISVDSALVFREMNIGTAKPDAETLLEVPHHLVNILDPTERYSAAQFCHDAQAFIQKISARGKIPLLAGGTMLYFNALQYGLHDLPQANSVLRIELETQARQAGWAAMHARLAQLDPQTAARLDVNDAQRIERALEVCLLSGEPMSQLLKKTRTTPLSYPLIKIALIPSDRLVLHTRIQQRFRHMLEQGLLDEIRSLQKGYPALDLGFPSMRCVGYRQAWQYLAGEYDLNMFETKSCVATRQLAKRQLTWLRSMRDCIEIDCLAPDAFMQIQQCVKDFLARYRL